jgi:phage terminase large subunit
MRDSMETMRTNDYDKYLHIYEGNCQAALEGAVYARELREATKAGRICRVPFVAHKPVQAFWDLGRSDLTSIWFVQLFGLENRIVRYYANNGFHISHYIEELQRLEKEEGYTFGTMWLPHDADEKRLQSRRTTRQQVEAANYKVRIVPKISVAEGIQAARDIFPQCYFHEADAGDGIAALRQYHYDVKDDGTRAKNPKHDWSSNGADAFRYMGVALREEKPKGDSPRPAPRTIIRPSAQSWMSR